MNFDIIKLLCLSVNYCVSNFSVYFHGYFGYTRGLLFPLNDERGSFANRGTNCNTVTGIPICTNASIDQFFTGWHIKAANTTAKWVACGHSKNAGVIVLSGNEMKFDREGPVCGKDWKCLEKTIRFNFKGKSYKQKKKNNYEKITI